MVSYHVSWTTSSTPYIGEWKNERGGVFHNIAFPLWQNQTARFWNVRSLKSTFTHVYIIHSLHTRTKVSEFNYVFGFVRTERARPPTMKRWEDGDSGNQDRSGGGGGAVLSASLPGLSYTRNATRGEREREGVNYDDYVTNFRDTRHETRDNDPRTNTFCPLYPSL